MSHVVTRKDFQDFKILQYLAKSSTKTWYIIIDPINNTTKYTVEHNNHAEFEEFNLSEFDKALEYYNSLP